MNREKIIKVALLGGFIGDALGVPYEFLERDTFVCRDMTSCTSRSIHKQEKGTWSDDTSTTLCLIDAYNRGYSKEAYYSNLFSWYHDGKFTHNNKIPFDVGISCAKGIVKIKSGLPNEGAKLETSNGNGALMRIFPVVFTNHDPENIAEVKALNEVLNEITSPTHNHIISHMACLYYVLLGKYILNGNSLEASMRKADEMIALIFHEKAVINTITKDVQVLNREDIKSTGYVYDTLLASIWCVYHSKSYKEAVLTAVNLGGDCDTIGLVTGHISALYYSINKKSFTPVVPMKWIGDLKNKKLINELVDEFARKMSK